MLAVVRQTRRNQLLPSEHSFNAVQILDAAGIWTEAQGARKQVATGMAAVWVGVNLRDSVTREHWREVLGLSVLRELADNATEFLNVVIGTIDGNHLFPEDIIVEENELLVAMHFTVAAPTAADWIGCFHRREVMTGRHSTRLHLFAAEMANHFHENFLGQTESLREALSQRIFVQYVVQRLDGSGRDGHCV